MEKADALAFLQLADDASYTDIKREIEEKLLHYEQLTENAQSDFVRRLNEKNVEKVKLIKQYFLELPPVHAGANPGNTTEEKDVLQDEEDTLFTEPVIIAGTKLSLKKEFSIEPAGWLVKHDAGHSPELFALFPGKNFLGRKASLSCKPFILINGDEYISRVHAIVYCVEGNPFSFFIEEPGAADKLKRSKNGIYINGNESRITSRPALNENDTIQVGETKLILRVNNAKRVSLESEKNKFMDTAVIKIPR